MTTGADRFKRLDQYGPVKVLGIEIGTDSYREDQRTTRDCQQNGTVTNERFVFLTLKTAGYCAWLMRSCSVT